MTQTHAIEDYVHTLSAATAELADALDHEKERTLEFRPPLGTVQRRIVALAGMASPDGMRVAEIARQANRPGGPSTHIVLDTLHRRGVVESLPGERFRLAPQYRPRAALAAVPSTPRHRASMRA